MALPPENYFKIGPYLDVFQGVHTALDINEGIIKVVGPDGVGKSTFCLKLIEELEAQGQQVIYFEQPPQSAEYLHEYIQNALGLDKNKNFNRALTRFIEEASAKRKLVIIYNDAEKISKDLFILIRLLNNIHDHSATLVSQIIVGTSKLDELFDDPALRSLTQYLNQSFTLLPMSRVDLDDFYTSYKNAYGITGKDMSNKELTDLFILSKGLPGKSVQLLDNFFRADEVNQSSFIPLLDDTYSPNEDSGIDTLSETSLVPAPQVDVQPGPPALEEPDYLQNLSLLPMTEQEVIDLARKARKQRDAAEEDIRKESSLAIQADDRVEPLAISGLEEDTDTENASETFISEDTLLPPLGEIAAKPADTGHYARELDKILEGAAMAPVDRSPPYFKFALSAIVVIASMVLGFVLSGGNDTVNDKLAEILALETPLYLDEISAPINRETASGAGQITTDGNTGIPTPVAQNVALESPQISSTPVTAIPSDGGGNESVASTGDSEIRPVMANNIDPGRSSDSDQVISQDLTGSASESDKLMEESLLTEKTLAREVSPLPGPEEAINSTINRWLSAWQEGRFEDYLAVYHDDFIPAYHDSRDVWLDQRQARIQGVSGIGVSVDRMEFITIADTQVTVEFWLQYSRGSYADETLKQLQFKLDGRRWLIESERNLEVIQLN